MEELHTASHSLSGSLAVGSGETKPTDRKHVMEIGHPVMSRKAEGIGRGQVNIPMYNQVHILFKHTLVAKFLNQTLPGSFP